MRHINRIFEFCILVQAKSISQIHPVRVATDLENLEKSGNLKETFESQGICDRIPKVREKSENFVV